MGQQVNVYRKLKFYPGATVEGWPGMGQGTIYYVNGATGTSGASGLSWRHAMLTINEAITASEVVRAAGQGLSGTTNDYIRNTIIIQATGEYAGGEYDAVTALPLHCDIIGLGDWPCGMGQGMVMIGAKDANLDAINGEANTVRGLNLINLHVSGDNDSANTLDAMSVANFFRSRLEDCWFGQSSGGDNINAGIECDSSFSGNLVRHCVIGATNTSARPRYGMDFASCSPGSNNLIEDNLIYGETTGILMTATDNWNGATIRNNVISGITAECSGTGITAALYVTITGNFIRAVDALSVPAASQAVENFCIEGSTASTQTVRTS